MTASKNRDILVFNPSFRDAVNLEIMKKQVWNGGFLLVQRIELSNLSLMHFQPPRPSASASVLVVLLQLNSHPDPAIIRAFNHSYIYRVRISDFEMTQLTREDYTVALICTLATEYAVLRGLLDSTHEKLPTDLDDRNLYTLGDMEGHNVVIAPLLAGLYSTSSINRVLLDLRVGFPSIRFAFSVGIGSGVPDEKNDIRLGDVVVSMPSNGNSGVVQFDIGKFSRGTSVRTGALSRPPMALLQAVAATRAQDQMLGNPSLQKYLSKLEPMARPGTFSRPMGALADVLFHSAYTHAGQGDCKACDDANIVQRVPRDEILVHYGTIASNNSVIKDGVARDRLSSELGGVLCFEMEAAGLVDVLPCLVIRGICDYADSHKNKAWETYAAVAAAAYAKELLTHTPRSDGRTIPERQTIPQEQGIQRLATCTEYYEDVCSLFNLHVEVYQPLKYGTPSRGGEHSESVRAAIYTTESLQFWRRVLDPFASSSDNTRMPGHGTERYRARPDLPEQSQIQDIDLELKGAITRWIHLPANNVQWVKDLVKSLYHAGGKAESECQTVIDFIDETFYQRRGSTRHSHCREPVWISEYGRSCLVMPYLDLESGKYLNRNDVTDSDHYSNMKELMLSYSDEVIYPSRTLDQSYYEMMEDTTLRDKDQVVYRYTKRNIAGWGGDDNEIDPATPNLRLLMVSQFWLWKIDQNTIITTCPRRWHEEGTQLFNILQNSAKDWILASPEAWIMHSILSCVTFPEQQSKEDRAESYLNMFGKSIAHIAMKEVECYRKFKDAIRKQEVSHLKIEQEINLLEEIKDVSDELNMIKRVIDDQEHLVSKMSSFASTLVPESFEQDMGVKVRSKRIERMLEDALRIEKSLNHLLDLKQKQDNIEESKLVRKQAEDTAQQGQYILVFTVVTIVFTPLSFMAALFAIQISEFPHNAQGLNLSGNWVGRYMAAGELATLGLVILVLLLFRFRENRRYRDGGPLPGVPVAALDNNADVKIRSPSKIWPNRITPVLRGRKVNNQVYYSA